MCSDIGDASLAQVSREKIKYRNAETGYKIWAGYLMLKRIKGDGRSIAISVHLLVLIIMQEPG
jgi:hypothetical protein